MKIYTKVTISMDTGEVLDSESYEHDGPIAECKGGGGSNTEYVQSPQAQQIMEYMMPAAQRMGEYGGSGKALWNTGGLQSSLGLYPTSPYNVPSSQMMMPSAANIGSIAPEIQEAAWQPYETAIGNVVEQFGGGMGSARGGVSGSGANLLSELTQEVAPQYTSSLWSMVQPGLAAEYSGLLGAEQAAFGGRLAQAQAGTQEALQQYMAQQAAKSAPYTGTAQLMGVSMPTAVQQPQGGKK